MNNTKSIAEKREFLEIFGNDASFEVSNPVPGSPDAEYVYKVRKDEGKYCSDGYFEFTDGRREKTQRITKVT